MSYSCIADGCDRPRAHDGTTLCADHLREWREKASCEIERLRGRVAALEAALRPFAAVASDAPDASPVIAFDPPGAFVGAEWRDTGLTWGDFRRAAQALSGGDDA